MAKKYEIEKWITKNGVHIPILRQPKFKGYTAKQSRQILKEGLRKNEVNSVKSMFKDNGPHLNSKQDLYNLVLDKDSYANDPEYQKLISDNDSLYQNYNELLTKERDLYKQLDDELIVPEGKSRTLARMFGHYTDKGKQLKFDYDMVNQQLQKAEKSYHSNTDKIQSIDRKQATLQRDKYDKSHQTTASKNIKDDYDGFSLTPKVPVIQDALSSGKAEIIEMSPKEYLTEVAHHIFNSSTLESTIRQVDYKAVDKYASQMRQGVKFNTPYLDYEREEQEGRHRALAALLNGYDKIPVVIVNRRR